MPTIDMPAFVYWVPSEEDTIAALADGLKQLPQHTNTISQMTLTGWSRQGAVNPKRGYPALRFDLECAFLSDLKVSFVYEALMSTFAQLNRKCRYCEFRIDTEVCSECRRVDPDLSTAPYTVELDSVEEVADTLSLWLVQLGMDTVSASIATIDFLTAIQTIESILQTDINKTLKTRG